MMDMIIADELTSQKELISSLIQNGDGVAFGDDRP
jgi:hypothetical protein